MAKKAGKPKKDDKPSLFGNVKRISEFFNSGECEKVVKVVEESIKASMAINEAKASISGINTLSGHFRWKFAEIIFKISKLHSKLEWLSIAAIRIMTNVV